MSYTKIPIAPKQDFLVKIGNTSPVQAICEMIWNGFDAGANTINVRFSTNEIDGIELIEIEDDGCGIDPQKVSAFFGDLGDSWKLTTTRYKGRSLHGKNGTGRYKGFAIGNKVTWKTYFNTEDKGIVEYQIVGTKVPIEYNYSDVTASSSLHTGTLVTIAQIPHNPRYLQSENINNDFAKVFAGYLLKNPNVKLYIDGTEIAPDAYLKVVDRKTLSSIIYNDVTYTVDMEIVEWKQQVSKDISLCDSSGIELHTVENLIRTAGYIITIIIKSDFIRELDKENRLILVDGLDHSLDKTILEAKEYARDYIRARKASEHKRRVERWKADHIYPYQDNDYPSAIEQAERQVFDIIGVNVEDYLPSFEASDLKAKKFTFTLLAQAIKSNPESLQYIISEVLNLKKEEQEDLADLLKRTPLTNVIKCAKVVANRLDFLTGLENLLFDKDTKKTLLERDQLHKILEHEAWIFDENFALAASEATLEEVLKLHLNELGKRCDDDTPVYREGERQGRVDLMLSLAIRPRNEDLDFLVVELKRPSQKINNVILGQIQSYAFAVSKDQRFDKNKTRWKFIVVSNEMDEYAERATEQRDRPKGQFYIDDKYNIEVWAFTWAEILRNARIRLEFINKSLQINVKRENATEYLIKAYEKYIPDSVKQASLTT